MKRPPDIRRMYVSRTTQSRQTWQQQLKTFSEWAAKHNAAVAQRERASMRLKEITDGR